MLIVVYETTRTENCAVFQWNILKAVGFILNSSVLKHLKDISTFKNDIYLYHFPDIIRFLSRLGIVALFPDKLFFVPSKA